MQQRSGIKTLIAHGKTAVQSRYLRFASALSSQPLVDPGTVLDVELDSVLADDRLHLAHVSTVFLAAPKRATECPSPTSGSVSGR